MPATAPPTPNPSLWKRLLSAALTVAVVVIVFGFVIPQLADYRKVLDIIGDITAEEWVALIAFSAIFVVAYVFVLMAVLRSLRFPEGFVAQTAGTAITNSLPAGGAVALALNYAMYISWGFTAEAVTAGLLAAGVWDQTARFVLPVLAVTVVAVFGDAQAWMWLAAAIGIALVVGAVVLLFLVFRSERVARRVGGLIDRAVDWSMSRLRRSRVDMVSATLRFRSNVLGIVGQRWGRLTVATVVNHAAMTGVFVASIRAAGVDSDQLETAWIVLSFSLGRLLVAIPISPGGLGLVDFGYITLLGLGGSQVDANAIAAGVLLFRALTFFPPIPIGLASWLFWRTNKSWRRDWRTERRGEFAPPGTVAG